MVQKLSVKNINKILALSASFLLLVLNAASFDIWAVSGEQPTPVYNPINDYKIDTGSESVLVLETGRSMKLFMKNETVKTSIPLASKLMTALIAIESIPENTMITASSVAAAQDDASEISLESGEKYSLNYLLHALILKDNNAAAIALSEQLSGTREEFVETMNVKAKSFQMTDTVFADPTGLYGEGQVTTVLDLSRLLRFATSIPKLDSILKTQDSVFILSSDLTKHLINEARDIWTFADNTTGAFISQGNDSSSYCVIANSGQMGIYIIGVCSADNDIPEDVSGIMSSIYKDYEYSTLAVAGQTFPEQMTIGTEVFNLKFWNSIYYVHPRSVDFIYDTRYSPYEDISLPILTTNPVASVTFVLLDGTTINAELFPAVNIWSDSTIQQKLIDIYSANKDIANMILILFSLFFLLLCGKLFIFIRRKRSERK